jgi:hypothetical protein
MAGLKDSSKVIKAKLSALMGNQEGVSTLNAVNMLGWTGRGYEQGLAEAIWEEKLKVEYADLDKAYGEYKIGEDGITISKTMLGGGKEGSAKLAAVMSHEGVHALKGIRIEALAHLQGNSTYNAINAIFGLTADKEFSQGMISAIMNPASWKENTGDTDNWTLTANGGLEYDGEGWLKKADGSYYLDDNGNKVGDKGIETGLIKILGLDPAKAEDVKKVQDMMTASIICIQNDICTCPFVTRGSKTEHKHKI